MTKESELLVAHLSKEIEMANTQLVEQRTKNNLWVAFGPFLILGGVATNDAALSSLRNADSHWLAGVGLGCIVAYMGLGWVAANVERQIWDRANKCRALLAKHTGIKPADLVFSSARLRRLYLLIFGALGGVFAGLGWLLHSFN